MMRPSRAVGPAGAAPADRAGGLDDVERVVAVASAKGGEGKSTVAAGDGPRRRLGAGGRHGLGRRDLLVVDLPPGTGDVVLTTLQEVPLAGVVVVTTPFHASVADTNRTLALFRENDVPVLGAVLNMATFACPACGEEHDLFPGGGDRGAAEPPVESSGSGTPAGDDRGPGEDRCPREDHAAGGHPPGEDHVHGDDHAHDGDPAAALDAPVLASLSFSPALQGTPRPGAVPAPAAEMAAAVRERLTAVWRLPVPDDAVDVDLRGVPGEERPDAVRAAFADHPAGERSDLLSDRDPSSVRSLLADLAGVEPDEFPEFAVERTTPEVCHLRVRLPPSAED